MAGIIGVGTLARDFVRQVLGMESNQNFKEKMVVFLFYFAGQIQKVAFISFFAGQDDNEFIGVISDPGKMFKGFVNHGERLFVGGNKNQVVIIPPVFFVVSFDFSQPVDVDFLSELGPGDNLMEYQIINFGQPEQVKDDDEKDGADRQPDGKNYGQNKS